MEKKTKTADQVFIQWKTFCEKRIGKARYTQIERLESLDALCQDFVVAGISYDDAIFYKRKFVDFVVTREGMKGNGKHKGWKEKAAENFEGVLLGYYDGTFKVVNDAGSLSHQKKTSHKEEYGQGDYMIRMPIIVDWSKEKFGNQWSEGLCLEAHKIAGTINNLFVNEVLRSKWSKEGDNVPKWAKKYCI